MSESTRQQERDDRRQRIDARAQQELERERRRKQRALLRIAIPIAAGVLVLGGLIFMGVRGATEPLPGETLPDEGRNHVGIGTDLAHQTFPPASGNHYETWVPRGAFSDQPIDPGYWVHNLEHGYVVLLYKCPGDCTPLKNQLRDLYNGLTKSKFGYQKAVFAPDDRIDKNFYVVAWDHRLGLDSYDPDTIKRFYNAYVDRGPEDAQ